MTILEALIRGLKKDGSVDYKAIARFYILRSEEAFRDWEGYQDGTMKVVLGWTNKDGQSGIVHTTFEKANHAQRLIAFDNYLSELFSQ